MIYPQEATFDLATMQYSDKDVDMLVTTLWKICQIFNDRLAPVTGRPDMFMDIRSIQFVDKLPDYMRERGYLAIAYPDSNVNCVPAGLDREIFTPYTGVMAMELMHSAWFKITGDWPESNDVIHWLYNENHLYTYDNVTPYNFWKFGGSIRLVLPDVVYGWMHRAEIMDGIRSGRYVAKNNPYWTAAPGPQQSQSPSAGVGAEEHELEHVRNFLIYGDVNGPEEKTSPQPAN